MTLPAKTTIIGAITGVIVTGLLMGMVAQGTQLSSGALFVLWPSSLFGFGYNGGSFWTSLLIGTLEFGGSAAQYGLAGFVIGFTIDYFAPIRFDDVNDDSKHATHTDQEP